MTAQTAKKELPACPVETTLTLIGDKWKVLILRDLMPGTKRFGELKKSIGSVSQKVLTAQLRDMENNGLLTRTVYPEVPPRVEYSLTELGRSLKPILDAMWNWAKNSSRKNSNIEPSRLPVQAAVLFICPYFFIGMKTARQIFSAHEKEAKSEDSPLLHRIIYNPAYKVADRSPLSP